MSPVTIDLRPPLEILEMEAEALAGWLRIRTRPAIAARGKLLAALSSDDASPLQFSALEFTAIRDALRDVEELDAMPGLQRLLSAIENPLSARTRRASEIFVVQVASFGGPKLGFEHDPEGAWTDQNVHIDRNAAEEEMHTLETAEWVDEDGKLRGGVVAAVRVVTLEEIEAEMGRQRVDLITTRFRDRLSQLWDSDGA